MKRIHNLQLIVGLALWPAVTSAQLESYPIAKPTIDGLFTTPTEFGGANVYKVPGLATLYFGYQDAPLGGNNGTMYLHNDYWRDTVAEDVDYNYFYHQWPNGAIVEIWNFGFGDVTNDSIWINNSGLGTNYTSVDDRGFIVRLDQNPISDRHWLPGDPKPGDTNFNWTSYHGVFAATDFGPSREVATNVVQYEYSLMGGIWEYNPRHTNIVKTCTTITITITDVPGYPGGIKTEKLFDGTLHFVPEPQVTSIALVFAGILAVHRTWPKRRKSPHAAKW